MGSPQSLNEGDLMKSNELLLDAFGRIRETVEATLERSRRRGPGPAAGGHR